jgi:hypothetical protein
VAGSEDDTSSDSLNGADLALELGNAILTLGTNPKRLAMPTLLRQPLPPNTHSVM